MSQSTPTREAAFELFKAYNKTESLTRHALSVEGVMRHFAVKFGEDVDEWGIIGLVHDIDYDMYPNEHCTKAKEILTDAGWPESWVRAVVSHGWGIVSDVKPETRLEQTLYAIDELTGLISSTALVRPSRSVMDMKAKSIKKKWKDKSFAAGVDRSIIEKGAEMLGMDLPDLITETILGMRSVAEEIGLGMQEN
jgi:predicted hydrolase (HD superfamily)